MPRDASLSDSRCKFFQCGMRLKYISIGLLDKKLDGHPQCKPQMDQETHLRSANVTTGFEDCKCDYRI